MNRREDERFAVNTAPMANVTAYMERAIALAGAVPDGAPSAESLQRVGVVGAGTMGRGIALAFANKGRTVTIVDPSEKALADARAHIDRLTERQVMKGRISQAQAAAVLELFTFSPEMGALSQVDIVIEAVPEVLALKQKVLAELSRICGPNTILASNTSTLDIDAIADATDAPERVIGTHFFVPAQVNKLLELIPAKATSAAVLGQVLALANVLGKQAVVARNVDGFIGNRLFDRFHQEAMYLLEEGATPQAVDAALEAWGMAIGPLRALDLVGNDIPWGVRVQRAKANPSLVQPRIGDALCEAGFFGQKTGKGWYLYDAESPRGRGYDGIIKLLEATSSSLGITRREISADEIVSRCILALIREAYALLGEGVAARATDVDMVYVTGYGFPAQHGGPFALAKAIGLARVVTLAGYYGEISGKAGSVWRVPDTLIAAAKRKEEA
ncbi:MAG: NAD(P)-binding domain-containing protein [Rhodobacteraceae bacterium]|nr:NAD(P)-binding domain-containing protein [Paracoccaceae bacterium]